MSGARSCCAGRALAPHLVREQLAKSHAALCAPTCRLEATLREAERSHAVVHAPRAEPGLRHLEATTLAEQQPVALAHPHVLKGELAMPVRCIVIAEDAQRPHDAQPGRIDGHEEYRVGAVAGGRARAAHSTEHEDEPAARVARAAHPPLATAEHVAVLAARAGRARHLELEGRRVRRGDVGLGHRVARTDLPVEQRAQPARLLLGRAEAREQLHVARVWRGAVKRLGGEEAAPPRQLGERGVLDGGQTEACLLYTSPSPRD